ncbi:MAG: septal ring lytic transglycosylase RlpA family protein [Prochlorococcaceae cyanobacterium]|jgi:rare lipoprotein A
MRQTFSLGALVLLLSGSAMLPGLADSGRAASLNAEDAPTGTSASSEQLAVREAVDASNPQDSEPVELPAPVAPQPSPVLRILATKTGQASWYGPGFYGRRTASGERFVQGTMTAAHPYLPFGTKVRVTNLRNGRQAVVRINDRGPFHGGRVIDLAHGSASALGLISSGVAKVKLEVLEKH